MAHSGSAFSTSSKVFLRGAIPERVLVEHPAIEKLLCFRRARRLEMDLAELVVVGLREGRQGERDTVAAMAVMANDVFVMIQLC